MASTRRRVSQLLQGFLIIIGLVVAAVPLIAGQALYSLMDPVHGPAGAAREAGVFEAVIKTEAIPGKAIVVWDKYGIPHIYADNAPIAFYALGWVEASQRLFQMDIIRRLPQARLSELLGEKALELDKLVASIGLPDMLDDIVELWKSNRTPTAVKVILESFLQGINDYIGYAIEEDKLPFEYRVLGLKPEPWTPRDLAATMRFLSFMLSFDTNDLILQKLVDRWGPEILLYMDIINRTRNVAVASCEYSLPWMGGAIILEGSSGGEPNSPPDPTPILKLYSRLLSLVGMAPDPLGASNNWVISGTFTKSGKPIVANDPHLSLTVPPIWMPVHIVTPNLKVAGVLIPGSPFVVIGRNEYIAWAFTNLMGDFTDFYYYVWNDEGEYYYKGKWLKPEEETIEFKVWDPLKREYKTVEYTIKKTIHGHLIEYNGTRYAVRWTGLNVSDEMRFLWKLNYAKSVMVALSAQFTFGSPIQNFLVADVQGNIAWSPVGYYPVRENLPVINTSLEPIVNEGFLPFNGSRGEGEWKQFRPLPRLPILRNPQLPYIATANTKPWDPGCGFYIGYNYADRFRLVRINELLDKLISHPNPVTVEDVMKVQTDTIDLGMLAYRDLLFKLLERHQALNLNDMEQRILESLASWNGSTEPSMPEPAIALTWFYEFHKELWGYLSGEENVNLYFFRFEYVESLVDDYLEGTPGIEKIFPRGFLENLALQTFRKAISFLEEYYGTNDFQQWRYGELHYYAPTHMLGEALPSLNYKTKPAPGGPYTINVAAPSGLDERVGAPVKAGPSVRLISDLGDSLLYLSLPGGVSGNPFSRHYSDLYEKWARGEYIVIDLNSQPGDYEEEGRLVVEGVQAQG